jgi:hypothetical protein
LLTPQLKAQKFHTISSVLYFPFILSNYLTPYNIKEAKE